jgi:hypothetical protein
LIIVITSKGSGGNSTGPEVKALQFKVKWVIPENIQTSPTEEIES